MTIRWKKVVEELASLVSARLNCAERGNDEWFDKHTDLIDEIVSNHMPRGSGIDNGTSLDFEKSTPGKLVFLTSYHHMNEGGMYDGWTDHKVIVTPSFDGYDMVITGRDRNGIKEYLAQVFQFALDEMWTHPLHLDQMNRDVAQRRELRDLCEFSNGEKGYHWISIEDDMQAILSSIKWEGEDPIFLLITVDEVTQRHVEVWGCFGGNAHPWGFIEMIRLDTPTYPEIRRD